jgi:hypothetical protein
MFLSQQRIASEAKRLQAMNLIRACAKQRAEQLRRDAISAMFQSIGAASLKVFTFVSHLGR